MKEDFILKVIEKFEKGNAVVLQIKQDDSELVLKKEGAFPKKEAGTAAAVYQIPYQGFAAGGMPQGVQTQAQSLPQTGSVSAAADTAAAGTPAQETPGQSVLSQNLIDVKSPIVGTFYRAPSPDSPPYVEKGSAVKKGQPLCVLEAMKMMNTLECEHDGVIEEISVSNGDLVEFDQVLFRIKTN